MIRICSKWVHDWYKILPAPFCFCLYYSFSYCIQIQHGSFARRVCLESWDVTGVLDVSWRLDTYSSGPS